MTGINTSLGINSVASTIAALGANGTQIVTTNTGAHVTGLEAAAYEFGSILASYPADGPPLTRNAAVFQVSDEDGNLTMMSLNDLADEIRAQLGFDPLLEFSAGIGTTSNGYSVADITFILNSIENRYSSMTFTQLAVVHGSGDLVTGNDLSEGVQTSLDQLQESFSNNLQNILTALDFYPDGIDIDADLISDSAAIEENAQLLSQLTTICQSIFTSQVSVANAQSALAAAQAGNVPADKSAVVLAQGALTAAQQQRAAFERDTCGGAPYWFVADLADVMGNGAATTSLSYVAAQLEQRTGASRADITQWIRALAPNQASDGMISSSDRYAIRDLLNNTVIPTFATVNQNVNNANSALTQAQATYAQLNSAAIAAAQTALNTANTNLTAGQAQLNQLMSTQDLNAISARLSDRGAAINALITQTRDQIASAVSSISSLGTQALNAQSVFATATNLSNSLSQAMATNTSNIAAEQAALTAKQLAQNNLTQANNALAQITATSFAAPLSVALVQGLNGGLQGLLSSISVPANQSNWTTLEAMTVGTNQAVGHFFMTSANLFAGASPGRDTNTGNIDLEIALFNDRTYIEGALTWDQAQAANPNITLDQWLRGGSGAPAVSARPQMFVELGGNDCPPFNGLISACGLDPNNPAHVVQFNAAMEALVPGITTNPIVTAQQLVELRDSLNGLLQPLTNAQQNVANAQQTLTTVTTTHTNAMSASASSALAVASGVRAIESHTGLSFSSSTFSTYGPSILLALSQPLVTWNDINAPGGLAAWNLPSEMSLLGSSLAVCGSALGGNQRSTEIYSKSLAGLLGIPRPATSGPNNTYTQSNINAQYQLVTQKLSQLVPDFQVPTDPAGWTATTLSSLQAALQARSAYLTPAGALAACNTFTAQTNAQITNLTQQQTTVTTGLPAIQAQLQSLQGNLLTMPETSLRELFSSIENETGVDLGRVIEPILTNGTLTKTDLNEIFTYLNQHLPAGATPFALISNVASVSVDQIAEVSANLNNFNISLVAQGALSQITDMFSQLTLSDLNSENFSLSIDSAVFSYSTVDGDTEFLDLNQVFDRVFTSTGVDLGGIFPDLADENGDISWSNLNAVIELYNQTDPSSEVPMLSSSILANSQTLRTDLSTQVAALNTAITSLTTKLNGLSGVVSTMSLGTIAAKQKAIVGMQASGAAFPADVYATSLAGLLGIPQIQPSSGSQWYSQTQLDNQYQLVVSKLNELVPDFEVPASASDWTTARLTSLQTQLQAIKTPLSTQHAALNSELSALTQNISTFNSILSIDNISSPVMSAASRSRLNTLNSLISSLGQTSDTSQAVRSATTLNGWVTTNVPSLLNAANQGYVGYRNLAVTGLDVNRRSSNALYASSLAGILGLSRPSNLFPTQAEINNQYTAVRNALATLVPDFQCPSSPDNWAPWMVDYLRTSLETERTTLLNTEASQTRSLNTAQTAILSSVSTLDLIAAKTALQNIQLVDVEIAVAQGEASAAVAASLTGGIGSVAAPVLSAAEVNSQLEDGDLYVNSRGQFFLNRQPTNARDASVAAFVISGTSLNDKLANLMNKVNLNNTRIQMANYLSAATSAADLQTRIAEQRTQYGFADIMSEITGGSMSDSDITSSTDITTATGEFQSALKTAINNATNNQDLDTQNLQQLTSQIQANSTAMTQIIQAFEQMLKGLSQNLR